MKRDLSIGEAAEQSGMSVETIRYYEREGLMPRVPRTESGRRSYAPSDLKTLAFIRNARELGFSLEDTRALLVLRGPEIQCTDVKVIAERHLATVRIQMRRIIEIEQILSDAV